MHIIKKSYRQTDFLSQDSTHWTHRLPSTAIMGLIAITGLLILILILDALRNNINIYTKHDCATQRKKKKKHEREKKQEIQSKEESEDIWDSTNYDFRNEENEHSEYGSMKNYSGQSPLLPIKEDDHYVEQEIKDLQGTVKSLQKEIITYYPITKID